jgi:hypothetical protein
MDAVNLLRVRRREEGMKPPHILIAAGNAHRMRANLAGVLDEEALQAIEDEIHRNVRQLFRLGRQQYRFACSLSPPQWRNAVSRMYFGAYNVSRAIRLCFGGEYSTDVQDHQKFEKLPADFPSKDRFANRFAVLRADRNLCDYDHTATAPQLVIPRREAEKLVKEFIDESARYLAERGVAV